MRVTACADASACEESAPRAISLPLLQRRAITRLRLITQAVMRYVIAAFDAAFSLIIFAVFATVAILRFRLAFYAMPMASLACSSIVSVLFLIISALCLPLPSSATPISPCRPPHAAIAVRLRIFIFTARSSFSIFIVHLIA